MSLLLMTIALLTLFMATPVFAAPLTAIFGGTLHSEPGLYFGSASVECPPGSVALGGGVDSKDPSLGLIVASAPHFGSGGSLRAQDLGTTSAPKGWYGGFYYDYVDESDPPLSYRVGAVCVEFASAVTVIDSFDLAASSTGTHWVACPEGTVALGGGVHPLSLFWQRVVSSAPYYAGTPDDQRLMDKGPGAWEAPIGWRVSVRNELSASQADIRVAAICADLTAESVITSILVAQDGGAEGVTASCPEETFAAGGGADAYEFDGVNLTTNGPAFPGGTSLADQAIGEQAAPTGWRGAMRNDHPDFDLPVRPGAICLPEPSRQWLARGMCLTLLLLTRVRSLRAA